MIEKLKEDAEYYLDWNHRKLNYFKEKYESIKELRDPKSMQLKYVFKSDVIRTLHEIAYIKCFLLEPKDVEAREKIENDLMNELEEIRKTMNLKFEDQLQIRRKV